MEQLSLAHFSAHFALAIGLFFLVNWIGKHAVDFGYGSTTLFEDPNESFALNFFIRALSPTVFIILVSSIVVALDRAELRLGIIYVVPYYYFLRAAAIFALNRHRLISWPKYFGHAILGMIFATAAYNYLILPNRSLLPDLETAGNELWLALLTFLYAVANKVTLSSDPGARRRNNYIKSHFESARAQYGGVIDANVPDDALKLVVYSVMIYEDYCRPPAVRMLERLAIWKKRRSTGIMQVTADEILDDDESVRRGIDLLLSSWERHSSKTDLYSRVFECISDYNRDIDYFRRVNEVMEILAKRVAPEFRPAYENIWNSE